MDLDYFFEQIETQFKEELPFVAYRKPNDNQLKSLIQKDSTLHEVVDFTESGFVFAPFDDSGKSILIPLSNSTYINSNFVISRDAEISHKVMNLSKTNKQFHIKLVKKAIDKIKENEFQKVVVSRKEDLTISDNHPIEIFKKLLNQYRSAFVYLWHHPKVGLWLGATPESLLKIEGNRFSTMALAGTQKFEGTLNVEWQAKEREEQQIVTDFIVESLSSVGAEKSAINRIQVSETGTIKAGNLLHLKTDISVNFKPKTINLKQIIQNLHPTPAVCGLPKENTKQFILENEDYNREYYTGFLGELNLKEKTSRNSNQRNVENNVYSTIKTISDLYVNLRCMQLLNDQAIIYIGGGITKDSDPEKEWEETVSKSEVIKSILSL